MLSAPELGLALIVVLAGSTVMGLVGFGIGMVVSPVLLLLIEPQSVVTTINSLSALLLTPVLFQSRRDVPVRDVLPMTLAGLLAVPIGVLILSSASPGIMRMTIAAIILTLAVPNALNIRRPLPQTRMISPLFGFLGSMLVTGLGVGVPLVALFLVNQGWSGREIRASIAFYYLIVAIAAVILYTATGLYTIERAWVFLRLAPAALLGYGLASLLVRQMDDRVLRYVVLAVIIASSLALLGREVLG